MSVKLMSVTLTLSKSNWIKTVPIVFKKYLPTESQFWGPLWKKKKMWLDAKSFTLVRCGKSIRSQTALIANIAAMDL